jgi:hypothetical protein
VDPYRRWRLTVFSLSIALGAVVTLVVAIIVGMVAVEQVSVAVGWLMRTIDSGSP